MPGTNEIGTVPIELDRQRRLRYDITALAELESLTGKSAGDIFGGDEDQKMFGLDMVRKMLYVGLIHEDTSLMKNVKAGVRRAGDLIPFAPGKNLSEKLTYVSGKITEAITASWGSPEDAEKNPQAPGETPPA
jgi:hypothetical protein